MDKHYQLPQLHNWYKFLPTIHFRVFFPRSLTNSILGAFFAFFSFCLSFAPSVFSITICAIFCIYDGRFWHKIVFCYSPFVSLHQTKWYSLCHTDNTIFFSDIESFFDVWHDIRFSRYNSFFIFCSTSENMDESKLKLLNSKFAEEESQLGDFPVVISRDNGIDNNRLTELFEISDSLDHLFPCTRCHHELIMSTCVEAMNSRTEFCHSCVDEFDTILHFFKVSSIRLNLDFLISNCFRKCNCFCEILVYCWFSSSKYNSMTAIIIFIFDDFFDFFYGSRFKLFSLISLYTKIAMIVTSESDFDVSSFHISLKKGIKFKFLYLFLNECYYGNF